MIYDLEFIDKWERTYIIFIIVDRECIFFTEKMHIIIVTTPVSDWWRRRMFTLDVESRENIFKATGMTVEQIINMDFDEIDAHIGRKVGHKITEYIMDDSLAGRGQVYSETKRFLYMEDVDKGLKEHDRRKSLFIKKNVSTI